MHLEVTKKVLHSRGWNRNFRGIKDSVRLGVYDVVQLISLLHEKFVWHAGGRVARGVARGGHAGGRWSAPKGPI